MNNRAMIVPVSLIVIAAVFFFQNSLNGGPIVGMAVSPEDNPLSPEATRGFARREVEQNSNRVCFDELCLGVEVVSTPWEINRGLMYRDGLEEGKGMLFVFGSERRRGFWMKNMEFSVDMIWIAGDGRVVHVERSVPPCREGPCPGYAPAEKAKYVLETRANFSAENGIDVGSEVSVYTS